MGELSGKCAFVTGAARGLGDAIARALHETGCHVVLADADPAVGETARAIDASGERATGQVLDVRDVAAFAAAFDATWERFGSVDIMVNNAGVTPTTSVWDIAPAEWDQVMAINLRGVFLGCQIAGRRMRERKRGRIINMASIAGQGGSLSAGAHYAASKAGILVLTKIFASELAPHSVTVNALAPSAIDGPIARSLPKERLDAIARTIPVGRLGRPEEVAAAVLYLASDNAGYVTGATIDINGGRLMR